MTKKHSNNRFARPNGLKKQKARILIVCEDSKITPNYLKSLRQEYGLRTTVRIIGKECTATDPQSIYECAKNEIEEDLKNEGEDNCFDKAYCVFDKDKHTNYQKTLQTIKKNSLHKKTAIIAIPSVPCFEFWALLHFVFTTRPFNNSSELGKELKEYITGYSKKKTELYPFLKDHTQRAINHSNQALKQADSKDTDNPSTHMHTLVKDLQNERDKL